MRKNLNLKIAIIKSGRWQYDIAFESQISYSRITSFINGYTRPRRDEAKRLAKVLNCTVEQLFPEGRNVERLAARGGR